jgi:hypothetical protein
MIISALCDIISAPRPWKMTLRGKREVFGCNLSNCLCPGAYAASLLRLLPLNGNLEVLGSLGVQVAVDELERFLQTGGSALVEGPRTVSTAFVPACALSSLSARALRISLRVIPLLVHYGYI